MSAPLLMEWMAYYTIEPFGEARADLRAGVIASLLANIHRDDKQQREPFEPGDFFASIGKREKRPWEKVFDRMRGFNMRMK